MTVFFYGEVPGIKQVKLKIFDIALVRLGTSCWKYLIVFAPYN